MKSLCEYIITFSHSICGIPCIIGVTTFHHQPPWNGPSHTCPSDIDYYGVDEFEFDVLDRMGYKAKWLESKLTESDMQEIENLALNMLTGV